MGLRSLGYPIVSQSTLTAFMARYLATAEGQATAEQFAAAGVQAYFIVNPVEDDIASSVAQWLEDNPPANGQNATTEQVQEAVDAYFEMYPPQPGPQGEQGPVGPSGAPISQAQLAAAVAAYLQANPPKPGATGPAGQNATSEQVASAVAAYMAANPITAAVNNAIAAYFAANSGSMKGLKGDKGDTGQTLVGTVAISQIATVAITVGIREVTVVLAGAIRGERYSPFVRSYKLNAGAVMLGRPVGYAIIDAVCNTDGQITVSLNAPLLTVGSSYILNTDIIKVSV